MADTIRIIGLDELLARLDEMQSMKPLATAMKAAAHYLIGKMQVYPPQKTLTRAKVYGLKEMTLKFISSKGNPYTVKVQSPFQTEKQHRWFFWALHNGKLTVPYDRGQGDGKSERFKASWAVKSQNGGLTQVIGNDTSYGPLLMDAAKQTKFAAAYGWKTTDAIMAEETEEVGRMVIYETKKLMGLGG
jgi:hypothetical protein